MSLLFKRRVLLFFVQLSLRLEEKAKVLQNLIKEYEFKIDNIKLASQNVINNNPGNETS